MKIERIDERTVKCFLSIEELEEYDISYKDFLMRSDKAREVVEDIIEQAEEEVGYQPPRFAFDLQIMMLPNQGMILTFSERDPEADSPEKEFMDCLRNMRDLLTGAGKDKSSGGEGRLEDWLNNLRKFVNYGKALIQKKAEEEEAPETDAAAEEAAREQTAEASEGECAGDDEAKPDFVVFLFRDMRSLINYARSVPAGLPVESAVYRMDGFYFLILETGGAPAEDFGRACIQAMEFAELYMADRDRMLWMEEHGECLIAEDALGRLRI